MKSFNLLTFGTAALLALTACGPAATSEPTASTPNNTLSAAEKAAGWQLLFNGTNFDGWHNFHSPSIAPGWQVKDGLLICADPERGGDIVTSNKFSWFELQLDYNITDGGNSGVMYHVTGEENANWPTWYTGPEFQLLDNVNGRDAMPRQMSGWLYGLYAPPDDPKTGLPLDTTKPVGQWNHIRLLVTPEKCEHDMNGVKYFEYVLHSPDFNARVARSKFSQMPPFAKSDTGVIALQGDHGAISFRNIKIRVINGK
ncbi:MAG: DUF1080 domain-containing protein [Verrucomicrobiota bacterium]|jgi:hypothetical protein